jgi:serine phosphatase RsbU (regulator of sigma subunit)/pSer/pThr/pTyr-binding forkhead associated (FHA) protein
MPSLILIKAPGGNVGPQSFPLNFPNGKRELVIGREKGKVDILVDDVTQQVSRKHAIVSTDGSQFFLENISRNGTLLNNRKIDNLGPQPLKPDDRVKICDFLFRFHDERTTSKPPLPVELTTALEDPLGGEETGETTTVQHTTSRAAAQQFLEVQPTERLRVLLDISTTLSRTLELDQLLPQIAETLFSVYKQADRCFVIQMDDAGRLYARVVKARRANTNDRFSKTIVRRCIETGEGYLSEDASSDQNLGAAQSIAEFRIRSVMCVPLITTDGKKIGALQLDTQDIGKKFKEDDLKLLTIVANLAAIAVEKAQLVAALLVREKAQRDIELGRQVQLGFLPKGPPEVPGYEFFGFYQAAQTVGGDYYDYIHLPGGRIVVVLGDVAGKGVPAAMLMAKLSAEARYCFLTEPNPAKAVGSLNSQLVRGGIGDRFVTLAALVIDPTQHTLTIVNAGHLIPLRYCSRRRAIDPTVSDDRTGLPLGVMDGYDYDMETVPLNSGESITIFTDGVTDARNVAEETFEMAGVKNTLLEDAAIKADPRPRVIGERLAAAVRKHSTNAPQADDIALVCFGRVEAPILSGPALATRAVTAEPN